MRWPVLEGKCDEEWMSFVPHEFLNELAEIYQSDWLIWLVNWNAWMLPNSDMQKCM